MATHRPHEELPLERPFDTPKRIEKGNTLAEITKKIEALRAKAKAAAKAAKEEIEAAEDAASALARELRTGKHVVPVLCEWRMHKSDWLLIASDTGDVVRSEPVTEADRQESLGFEEAS